MIVCICNWVSDSEIRELKSLTELKTVEDLQCIMKICDNCSLCKPQIESILENVETMGEKLGRESRKV